MDNEKTIRAYFDGINGERYDEVAALFAGDAELVAPGISPRRGRVEIQAYFERALRLYPEHRDAVTRFILAGDTAVAEIHFNGGLESGATVEFDAVDIFDLSGGEIVRLSSWFDSHAVRAQLRRAIEAGEDA